MAKYIADFRQGDTVKIKITYDAGTDITGFVYWLTLKACFEDADSAAVLQVETTAGDHPDDDVANGVVYIVASATDTAAVPPGRYYYDVQELSAGGEIRTLFPPTADYKDRLVVIPQVTRNSGA
jgi:hypothetical protein